MPLDWLVVTAASFLAGGIDSIVGGGGLILVPALFATYPSAPPATLLGTNKSASVWGTSIAAWQYSRRVRLRWRTLLPGAALALLGSLAGAWMVTHVDSGALRRALPFVLVAVLVYTLLNKRLGHVHAPRLRGRRETVVTAAIGLVIGWYDGFFGPGAGSFFVFALVRLLGYDFLNASAAAKVLNLATNAAAIALFASKGHVWWHLALPMALANVAGSLAGTRLAMRHGTVFVRRVFIGVVSMLILKTAFDAFLR